MAHRPHRERRCIAGCAGRVVARCQHRLQAGICAAGLCEHHVGPGTICPTHTAGEEPDLRCPASGFAVNGTAKASGEIYCAGCRVVVPVRDGLVTPHGRNR